MKKNILFTARSIDNINGAEKSMLSIMDLFNNNKVFFLAHKHTQLIEVLKNKNVEIIYYDYIPNKKHPFKTIFKGIRLFFLMKKLHIDIVYLNRDDTLLAMFPALILLKLFSKIKTLVHIREQVKLSRIQNIALNFVSKIIVNTDFMKKNLIQDKFHIKTNLLPPFVKINKIESKNKNIVNKDVVNICSIGRISDWKGQKNVVNAFIYGLKNRLIDDNFHINFFGQPESDEHNRYLDELKELIQQNNLQRNITFWGYVSNIEKYLVNQDIMFFLTSNKESAGRVFIEASAYNIPYIATDLPQLKEFTLGGLGGFWVDRDNYEEIIVAYKKLLNEDVYKQKQSECSSLYNRATNQESYINRVNSIFFN